MSNAIEIKNLSKRYYLGRFGYGSFQNDLKNVARRILKPSAMARIEQQKKDSEFYALRDVNLEIKPGERVGVIGENGAGKSTLLKILSRVTLPTTGEIRMRGKVASLLEVGTGFHPELTGRENIFLNGAIMGMTREDIRLRFDEIVDFSGIEKFIDTPVKRYSSGMYVRLAFAVAAHLEPDILILDEVLAVGDANFQKKCLGKMESVAKDEGRTIIFVSHAMGAVSALCNRALHLKGGKVVYDGTPKDAIANYADTVMVNDSAVTFDRDNSKEAQILEVVMKDHSGTPSANLDITKTFTVEVIYEIREPLIGVVVSAGIFTENQDCLLSSADHDIDRKKLDLRVPGIYKSSVTFPADIFNTGTFGLVAGISIPGKVIYDRREAIKFELIDGGSFMTTGSGEIRRSAHLLMALPWKETKTAEARGGV